MPNKNKKLLIILGVGVLAVILCVVCYLGYQTGRKEPIEIFNKEAELSHYAIEEEKELSELIVNNYKNISLLDIKSSEVNPKKTEYKLTCEITMKDSTKGIYNFVIHMDSETYTITYSSENETLEKGLSTNAKILSSTDIELN